MILRYQNCCLTLYGTVVEMKTKNSLLKYHHYMLSIYLYEMKFADFPFYFRSDLISDKARIKKYHVINIRDGNTFQTTQKHREIIRKIKPFDLVFIYNFTEFIEIELY